MSNTLTDQQLLAGLRQGNSQVVQKWFEVYSPKLLKVINHKVSNEKDAEELVQDVFMSCLKHLPLFRGDSNVWTWMLHVAHHEVADYYRKKYAKKILQLSPLSELLEKGVVHDAHEVSLKVRSVLQLMAQENREILLMKYVDKKKVADIARESGKTVKSVESILFRARNEFRILYSNED